LKRYQIAILLVGIIAIIVFIMPDTLSMFSGMHTFYADKNCTKCHSGEYNEFMASQGYVRNAHLRAANNTNYTTYLSISGISYNNTHIVTNYDGDGDGTSDIWKWNSTIDKWQRTSDGTTNAVSLDRDRNNEINGYEVCHLCHNSTIFGFSGAHTSVVRTCDDDRCHGNNNYTYNNQSLFTTATIGVTEAGALLSQGNVHSPLYHLLINQSSSYPAGIPFNNTPGNSIDDRLTKGYLSCGACHGEITTNATTTTEVHNTHANKSSQRRKYI